MESIPIGQNDGENSGKLSKIRWSKDLSYQLVLLVSSNEVHLTKHGVRKGDQWQDVATAFTEQTTLQTTSNKMDQHWNYLKVQFLKRHAIDVKLLGNSLAVSPTWSKLANHDVP